MADILFVNATGELAINHEVNGTMILATKLLHAGFDAQILRFCQVEGYGKNYGDFSQNLVERILQAAPRCVSFYTLWPYYHVMLRVARDVKKRNGDIAVVFGGPQASATAQDTMSAMEFVDYICTGEGEDTVVPFFYTLLRENGAKLDTIPGLYYRKDGTVTHNDLPMPLCDLNALPFWDDRLYADVYREPESRLHSKNYFMPIDAGRGCPYSCTFCCSSYFWRRTYRLKTPERIVDDIRFYNEKFGIRSFWFSHDAFTTNNALVSEVCDRILKEGLEITWRCSARIDCITEELILKMKRAGLTEIELGIETGSPRMQKLINKHLNLEKAQRMTNFLLKNGIRVCLFFMYGLPDETEQDLNQTLNLLFDMLDAGVHHVDMSFCRFNPTTAITEKYFDELVLDPKMQSLNRSIFGYDEEYDIISQNKALFPFLYHLPTALREEYQYLFVLVHAYQQLPGSAKHLRALYNGDDLKLYRDFYHNNPDCFGKGMAHTIRCVNRQLVEMMENTAKDLDAPYIRQLTARMKLEHHIRRVRSSAEDIAIQDTYELNYIDFMMKRPIGEYSAGKSELLLTKTNGVFDIKILRIQ